MGWRVIKTIGEDIWQCLLCSGANPQQWNGLNRGITCTISNVTKHVLRKHKKEAKVYQHKHKVDVDYNYKLLEWILIIPSAQLKRRNY